MVTIGKRMLPSLEVIVSNSSCLSGRASCFKKPQSSQAEEESGYVVDRTVVDSAFGVAQDPVQDAVVESAMGAATGDALGDAGAVGELAEDVGLGDALEDGAEWGMDLAGETIGFFADLFGGD